MIHPLFLAQKFSDYEYLLDVFREEGADGLLMELFVRYLNELSLEEAEKVADCDFEDIQPMLEKWLSFPVEQMNKV